MPDNGKKQHDQNFHSRERGKKMKKLSVLIVFLFAFTVLSASVAFSQAKPGPAKPAASKEPIKIGAIYDFAGACYMYSDSAVHGIRIAIDEINAKGGILGRKLELTVRDTEAKVDVAVREVKDLILREKVNFLTGPCSSGTALAMQVVHSEYKVLRVTNVANTEGMTVDKFTPYVVHGRDGRNTLPCKEGPDCEEVLHDRPGL
jgi:branched-chain amino acid transport system substrate-binding protein